MREKGSLGLFRGKGCNFVCCDAAVTVHPEQPSKLPVCPHSRFRLVIVTDQWFLPVTEVKYLSFIFVSLSLFSFIVLLIISYTIV